MSSQLERIRAITERWLIEKYGFPNEWLDSRIRYVEKIVSLGSDDLLFTGFEVITKYGDIYLLVSLSEESVLAEELLKAAMVHYKVTGVGISTDGTKEGTKYIRRRFDKNSFDYVPDIESHNSIEKTVLPAPFVNNKDALYLKKLSRNIEDVFFQIHSHIRDIDGLHSDEALDELCKILFLKMFDEESTQFNEEYKLQRWIYGSYEELAASVRGLYERAVNAIDAASNEKGIFNNPIKLSSPALSKAIETIQDYNISESDIDVKGRAFQNVLGPTMRSGMGQYFTPNEVIKFMVSVAQPSVQDLILDPFSGSGHFLSTSADYIKKNREVSSDDLTNFIQKNLHGFEKSDRMVRIAMTDMKLLGVRNYNIRCTDSLLDFSNYHDILPETFDLILTNPPFGSVLGKEAMSLLGSFQLAKNTSTALEILGLERSLQLLKPGGRLGIVLPDGLLVNPRTKSVREWLEYNSKIRAIISLPVETFSPFGANVKTSILFVRKWLKGELITSNYNVFFGGIENIGYDSSGKMKKNPDYEELASELIKFFEDEGW